MRLAPVLTWVVCLVALLVTWGMFALVGYHYNSGRYAAIFGIWDSAVFLALALIAVKLRKSSLPSLILLGGSLFIAGFSLLILYQSLHFYFTPPGPSGGPRNCIGPLVEMGLPLLQLPCLFVIGLTAYLMHRKVANKRPPVSAS